MLDAGEALVRRRCDDAAIFDERRRRID